MDITNLPDEQDSSNESYVRSDPLPTELFRLFLQSVAAGSLILICFIIFSVLYGSAEYLSGAILGLFLFGRAYLIKWKWRTGRIQERLVRCLSCQPIRWRKVYGINSHAFRLICTDEKDENTDLYEFTLGNGADAIGKDTGLLLYVDDAQQQTPLAWKIVF